MPFVVFIKGLLENAGTEINPVALIKRIRDGLEIPGLRDALVKILQDTNLQVGWRVYGYSALYPFC